MGAGRAGRRSRSRSRRRRFEFFRTGSESGDGSMMEGGVQMDAVDQEQPRGKGSRIFTILFLVVIVLVVLGALTLFQRRAPRTTSTITTRKSIVKIRLPMD